MGRTETDEPQGFEIYEDNKLTGVVDLAILKSLAEGSYLRNPSQEQLEDADEVVVIDYSEESNNA